MVVTLSENAWEDYLYWQKADKKILKEINNLIKLDEYKQDQL